MQNDLNKKGFHKSYCPGCLPRGKNCTFMKESCSLLANGSIRFCHECTHFPCARLKSLDKRYSSKYHMSVIQNLNNIKDQGMEAFLEEEEKKWRCPECGSVMCCHNGLCMTCNLDKLRQNKKYRWGEE